jgi:tetratricopeptide (TPR) repeat protein
MEKQRLKAYHTLIDALLTCPTDEKLTILGTHQELIDEGLVQILEQVAAVLVEEGNQDAANWLRNLSTELATKISNPLPIANSEAYLDFLIEVLQATEESSADPQVVYPLMEANLDKLDDNFARVLRDWTTAIFSEVESQEAYGIAVAVGNFSLLIQEFPIGNLASNIEIAIIGYEVSTNVLTREAFPQGWIMIQDALGNAYCDRIGGDWVQNQESAIAAFQSALQGYTREAFPEDWARTQNNLATIYTERTRGDKAENLELAIICCENALQIYRREVFPEDWAMVLMNLGAAYRVRVRGDTAENIEMAICCYKAALEEHTRERFPEDWAGLQNNLGNAYRERIRGNRAENLERSRSKRLVDLMASNDLYQGGEIPPEVKELLQQYEDLQQRIDQERSQNESGNNRKLMDVRSGTRSRAAFQAYNRPPA